MDLNSDILFKLIANPYRVKRNITKAEIYNDNNLHEELKKKYSGYIITDKIYIQIKKGIEDILINNEINLIMNEMINDINMDDTDTKVTNDQ